MNKNKGFANIILLIMGLVVIVGLGVYALLGKSNKPQENIEVNTPTVADDSPSPQPTNNNIPNTTNTSTNSQDSKIQQVKQQFPSGFPFPSDSQIIEADISDTVPISGISGKNPVTYFLTYSLDENLSSFVSRYGDFLEKNKFIVTNSPLIEIGYIIDAKLSFEDKDKKRYEENIQITIEAPQTTAKGVTFMIYKNSL